MTSFTPMGRSVALRLLLPAALAVATWLPDRHALHAARGETVRCLHREGKSNAYFWFYDSEAEAAAYAQATPTEVIERVIIDPALISCADRRTRSTSRARSQAIPSSSCRRSRGAASGRSSST